MRRTFKSILFLASLCCIQNLGFSQIGLGLDSLKDYSYLLIEASYHPRSLTDIPTVDNISVEGFGTGFFIKRQNRIFLVTAYHIPTQCDIYAGIKKDSKSDLLLLRFYDSLGGINFWYISTAEYKKLPAVWFYEQPDVITIEVTDQLKNTQLKTIDNILFQKPKKDKLRQKAEKSVVSFGFPETDQKLYSNQHDYIWNIKPSTYKGRITSDSSFADPLFIEKDTAKAYLITTPYQIPGVSGCPVFSFYKNKKMEWIEFSGVQSGSSLILNSASIVDKKELFKRLPQEPIIIK